MKTFDLDASLIRRFWAKVLTNTTGECWLWTGSYNKQTGYGQLAATKSTQRLSAHVVSWVIHFGFPTNDDWVLHTCDVKRCVKPEHLFLGDRLDNVADCCRKGRTSHGVDHPFAKLLSSEVESIKHLSAQGISQREIGRQLGVNQSHVSRIVNNLRRRDG